MFTMVDGVRLHYEQEGQGTDLVLIHGLGMSLRDWDQCTPELTRYHRVLRVEVRGLGNRRNPVVPILCSSLPVMSQGSCDRVRSHVPMWRASLRAG